MTTAQITIQIVSILISAASAATLQTWRRGRDSNPRRPLSRSGFQDRRDRPLCHLSGFDFWQGGRDSNPQPTVLETATLPIELPPLPASVASCLITKPRSANLHAQFVHSLVLTQGPPSRDLHRWSGHLRESRIFGLFPSRPARLL